MPKWMSANCVRFLMLLLRAELTSILFVCFSSPSCAAGNASSLTRRIAYYELFALTSRPCDTMQPEAIAAGALTHINLAFILFDDTYNLVDTQGDLVARVSRLKATYPGLRVNAAIGGWAFNDAPTQYLFSNMASTYENRQTFISSVMSYLTKYGLDGIDIGAFLAPSIGLGFLPFTNHGLKIGNILEHQIVVVFRQTRIIMFSLSATSRKPLL
jgi:hypothetical protein